MQVNSKQRNTIARGNPGREDILKYSEPHIRTTIRLPPALYRRLVRAAAEHKVASIQAAVVEGCEGLLNWIEKQEKKRGKK